MGAFPGHASRPAQSDALSLIQRAVDKSEAVQAARRVLNSATQELAADDAGDPKAAAAAAGNLVERAATFVRQGVLRDGDAAVKAARDAASATQQIVQLRQASGVLRARRCFFLFFFSAFVVVVVVEKRETHKKTILKNDFK